MGKKQLLCWYAVGAQNGSLLGASYPSIACRSSSAYSLVGNHPSITLGYAVERLGSVRDINFFVKKR